ncbi:unnamed protein product [Oikopleura dioica]|uniref:Uncharacterized protein n=1 Tax=Oikopleura dioica TaxID=34765 RepID=E4Y8D3_OIKDI|nr:unnamed protein product [Oikopleura dioica]
MRNYFLGGRAMNWAVVGLSLFVSNIGSEHLIGLAGSGASSGISVASYELNAVIILQLLGHVFVPVYIASGVTTLPEYLEKRLKSRRLPVVFSIMSLVMYVLTKISVNLYSGSIFMEMALGWNKMASCGLLLLLTALLTVAGGLSAVMYTDAAQGRSFLISEPQIKNNEIFSFIMVTGMLLMTVLSWKHTGLNKELQSAFLSANNNASSVSGQICAQNLPSEASFKLLRSNSDPEMPWMPFIFGQTFSSIWYWCTDQVIVQRSLSAKNLAHSQGGSIIAGLLKFLPALIMVFPGMLARIIFPKILGCVPGSDCFEQCGEVASCANHAFPLVVLYILPSGVRGLMFSVVIAALMSGLDSIFNSASTLFTIDIWQKFRPDSSEKELIFTGRIVVIVVAVLSILWIPMVESQGSGRLFYYVNEVSNHFSPVIAAVFVLAVLWDGLKERGAFWGSMIGFSVGLLRLILLFAYPADPCVQIDKPWLIENVHYMTYTAVVFLTTLVTTVIISLLSPEAGECSKGLTFSSRYDGISQDKIDNHFEKEEFIEKHSTTDLLYIPKTSRYLINSISGVLCLLASFMFVYYSV